MSLLDLRSLLENAGTITADASLVEADDLLSSAVSVLVQASAASTEADDTLAAAGVVSVQGAAALTEAADSLSASGVAIVSCAAVLTEADDSLAAAGAVLVQAAETSTEAADALAAAAVVLVLASAALPEADDAVSASGTVADAQPVTGDAALTEDGDTVAGFGVAGFPFNPLSTMSYPLALSTRGRRNKPRPPLAADAFLIEASDGVESQATVVWPLRARRVRDEEWLLRRAA